MQQRTISRSYWDEQQKVDFIQLTMTSSAAGWRRSSKALPRAELAPKKNVMDPGGLLPVWPTTAFWIPVRPLHLRSMLNKLMRHIENCSTWSWHWSTQRAQIFSMTASNQTLHNQCFRSRMNWLQIFGSSAIYIHLTSCQLFQHLNSFWRANASTISRRQKMISRYFLFSNAFVKNTKAWIFMLQK